MFETTKKLPFLHYQKSERGTLSLHLEQMELEPERPIVWSLLDTPSKAPLQIAANMMRNVVGARTRRCAGNIIIVPMQLMANALRIVNNWEPPTIIVDDTLAANEIRVTFWRVIDHGDGPLAVDGGLQYSPEGWSYNPWFADYFVKYFL